MNYKNDNDKYCSKNENSLCKHKNKSISKDSFAETNLRAQNI
jgi:hypothetical protein